jgi:hypothetical protein
VDTGLAWETNLNTSLQVIDKHNHTSGLGVQIPVAGLNINADLPFNSNNATLLRSLRFTPQPAPLALGTDLGCLYESVVDLWYNDGNGNQIQITQNGSVKGAAGTITGLPSGSAGASYATGQFTFLAATNTGANLSLGSLLLSNGSSTNPYKLTLQPPTLGSNYSLTLPVPPTSSQGTSFVTIDTAGNMGTASNISPYQIAAASITGSQLASATITSANIASATITSANIASATITGSNIAAGTITRSNIANGVGQVVSSTSGAFNTSSSTYVNVISLSITTYGNPVVVMFMPDGSGNFSNIGGTNSTGGTAGADIVVQRDGLAATWYSSLVDTSANSFAGHVVPPGCLNFIDVGVGAGTHSYTVEMKVPSNGDSSTFSFIVMVAYELI